MKKMALEDTEMKLSRVTKIICFTLSMILLLSVALMFASAEEIPQFVEGETIYDPVLTGSGHGVPEGWMAVPETQVPWPNGGSGGGWINFDASNTHNTEINPEVFTFTATGLAVSIGQCDFSVVFPALVDSEGAPVETYMYSITFSGAGSNAGGSLGPITDAQGGDRKSVV